MNTTVVIVFFTLFCFFPVVAYGIFGALDGARLGGGKKRHFETRRALRGYVERRNQTRTPSPNLVFRGDEKIHRNTARIGVPCTALASVRWSLRRPVVTDAEDLFEAFRVHDNPPAWLRGTLEHTASPHAATLRHFSALRVIETSGDGRVWIDIAAHYAPYDQTYSIVDTLCDVLAGADSHAEKAIARAAEEDARRREHSERERASRNVHVANEGTPVPSGVYIPGALSPEGAPVAVPARMFVDVKTEGEER